MIAALDRVAARFERSIRRLPRGTEPSLGAGYAMVAGTVLSAFLFALVLAPTFGLLGPVASPSDVAFAPFGYALVSLPLVDPSTLAPSAGDTALTLLLLVPFVFLYLLWAILPVGAAVGGLYERGRRQLDGSGR